MFCVEVYSMLSRLLCVLVRLKRFGVDLHIHANYDSYECSIWWTIWLTTHSSPVHTHIEPIIEARSNWHRVTEGGDTFGTLGRTMQSQRIPGDGCLVATTTTTAPPNNRSKTRPR